MTVTLSVKDNAIDSFNESLLKYKEGEEGDLRAYKFAILHMAHFLELTLKMYVQTLDANLVFTVGFFQVEKLVKAEGGFLKALEKIKSTGGVFPPKVRSDGSLSNTITVDHAISFAAEERCSVTGVNMLDQTFIDDIIWLKNLRNNIEHYTFELTPKDVRLCLGRIVRGADEFADLFSLFNLSEEIDSLNVDLYKELVDEYSHTVREANIDADQIEFEALKGYRQKELMEVTWARYECPACGNNTLLPEDNSGTGYRCLVCDNEESDEIEVKCDICGDRQPQFEMQQWSRDDDTCEWRCYYCSGQYHMDKDD